MKYLAINLMSLLFAITVQVNAGDDNNMASINMENEIPMEEWMFEELKPNQETDLEMENWMFEPLQVATENELVLENWMFKSLIK